MTDSVSAHRRWQAGALLASAVMLLAGVALTLPLAILAEHGVSLASLAWVRRYLLTLQDHPAYWLEAYRLWILQRVTADGLPPLLLLPPGLAVAMLALAAAVNPHRAIDAIHGRARWARSADLRRMRLQRGLLLVLGSWRGRRLKLPETLSALCLAPPGTGKTAAVVVPTILDGDRVSMVINDVKPELHQITSGYRQRLGPVVRLDWAAVDDPERGVRHPCWNPLSPSALPRGPARDLYIDRLATILIPDPVAGADPHWSRKGRAALVGLTHFIIDKVKAGDMTGLTDDWQGAEPSFPMLLDWLTDSLLAAAARCEQRRQTDPNAAFADPMQEMLMAAVREAQDAAYDHRAILELTQLANTPERERGSILSTMDAGLAIFKNQAVRQRTRRSDISFADLRGSRDRRGKFRPMTLYLCVTVQDIRSLGVITGLFVEALSAYLIAHAPGTPAASGKTHGPCPVLFVLDEFPQLPKIPALIDGPAVGRGQKLSYLLIGQDFAQIEEKYGKTGLETLLSTTAAKIILPLNNEQVAKRFSDMVGSFTHEGESRSRSYGFSRQADPFATNVTKSLSAVPLIPPADFMSMAPGTQIVLYQSFANCPLRLKSPLYYRDPALRRRAYDPRRGKGPDPLPACCSVPPELRQKVEQRHQGAVDVSQSAPVDGQAQQQRRV